MQRTPLPDVINVSSPAWPRHAYESLKTFGCARLKLKPSEAWVTDDLYAAMEALSKDRYAQKQLEVSEEEFDNLDQRSGYAWFRHRSIFELHCESPSAAALSRVDSTTAERMVQCAWDYSDMCEARCLEALQEVVASSPCCRELFGEDQEQQLGCGIIENMLRVYRYNESYDKPDGDIDAHFDIGLLTIIPRSTHAGLMIQPHKCSQWFSIEEHMDHGEALLFGGLTLARLTGIPALRHGVLTNGSTRFSAPYFQRVAPHCVLPASPGHAEEKIKHYNQRLRDAENDELRSDGSIVLRRRHRSRSSRRRTRAFPAPSRGYNHNAKDATCPSPNDSWFRSGGYRGEYGSRQRNGEYGSRGYESYGEW